MPLRLMARMHDVQEKYVSVTVIEIFIFQRIFFNYEFFMFSTRTNQILMGMSETNKYIN